MCPKEQQTSDNPIAKDYCFIMEILDKFSFSGMLKSFKWSLEKTNISQTTGIVKKIIIHDNSLQCFFIFARANFPDSHRTN